MIEIPEKIINAIAELGVKESRSPLITMQKLYAELIAGNEVSNLTRVTSLEDYWERHVLDSLLILRDYPQLLTDELRIADVGCGGGFPILPLAWANPKLQIVGIEARGKKTNFVSRTAMKLGLGNVSILNMQAREAGRKPEVENSFDIVLLRAVGTTGKMLKECRNLIKKSAGAKMISYKTPQSAEEEKTLAMREAKKFGFSYSQTEPVTLSDSAGQRLFVELARE